MEESKTGILNGGGSIEVATMTDCMIRCVDSMRCVWPHYPIYAKLTVAINKCQVEHSLTDASLVL